MSSVATAKSPAVSVRIAASVTPDFQKDYQGLCDSVGLDLGTGMKMAMLHSLGLFRQGQAPFGTLPIASYRRCRQAISDFLNLGGDQAAFDVFYANPETNKKVTIANHVQFLDDGIAAGWAYRDGSTNQKLCYRLMWALDQVAATLDARETSTAQTVTHAGAIDWMNLAREAALVYP